jgi:hypothetical protein
MGKPLSDDLLPIAGDGVTDDGPAIQQRLNILAAKGAAGVVYDIDTLAPTSKIATFRDRSGLAMDGVYRIEKPLRL